MIKLDNYGTAGWEAAVRGMRNPMNSWDKSDSGWDLDVIDSEHKSDYLSVQTAYDSEYVLGPNDRELMMKLSKAGTDHRKFMRMITVYVDILAPLYWWKEFDTYKVGTVANSCSTMHKIHEKPFTFEDFSCEHLFGNWKIDKPESEVDTDCYIEDDFGDAVLPFDFLHDTVSIMNKARERFLETNDKVYWWQIIQLLPSSYNQKRTIMLNYEVLANIYKSRKNHKLDEWREFCKWIETLPYSELITLKED